MSPAFTLCAKKTHKQMNEDKDAFKEIWNYYWRKKQRTCPRLTALGPSLQLISRQDVNAKHSMNLWHYSDFLIQCSFGFLFISKNHQIESSTKVSLGCFKFPHSHTCPTWGWPVGTREQIDGLVLPSDTASMALRAAHFCSIPPPNRILRFYWTHTSTDSTLDQTGIPDQLFFLKHFMQV